MTKTKTKTKTGVSDVDKKLASLTAKVENLDGLNYELACDMLAEYAWMLKKMGELKEVMEREGIVREVERGGENNRHLVQEESKHFTAYGKLASKAVSTAGAIKRFCRDNATEAVDTDEFANF